VAFGPTSRAGAYDRRHRRVCSPVTQSLVRLPTEKGGGRDASALIEVLLGTSAGSHLAERVFAEGETLHAPHLLDVEVAHVFAGMLASAIGHQARIDLV
jgi:hypothetical protein